MNNKSITPNPQQPVDRVPTGQLPSALAELSEAALEYMGKLGPASSLDFDWDLEADLLCEMRCRCSYDGDDF